MIYTEVTSIVRYKGITDHLDRAINYLADHSLADLPVGRTEIDGDNVFVNRMSYETIDPSEGFFEAHIEYIDIHVILSGKEQILISDCSELTEVRRIAAEDFIEYKGNAGLVCHLCPGHLLIAFPEDAHMVKIIDGEKSQVEKAVIKVRIN